MAVRRGVVNAQTVESFDDGKKVDPRFFKPQTDKSGHVSCIIRFLPSPEESHPSPMVAKATHSFDGVGGKFYERCLSMLPDVQCPICKEFFAYKERGDNYGKKFVRSMKYITNILVIDDPVSPQNNGKVFLYELTYTMWKKVQDKIKGSAVEKGCVVMDYYEGANFILSGKPDTFPDRKGNPIKYTNYDGSYFKDPTALEESVIDIADAGLYNLSEFDNPSLFKTPEELIKRFNEVEGKTANGTAVNNPFTGGQASTNDNTASSESAESSPRAVPASVENIESRAEVNQSASEEDSEEATKARLKALLGH